MPARMTLPPVRRIIFSRKGLDSAAGGGASPIIDGRPLSLPIPAGRYPGGIPYARLAGKRAALAAFATNGRVTGDTLCHLDPDIDAAALDQRPAGWRGAFGQTGAALGHLRRQAVGPGDLFLFFGRFRSVEAVGDGWRWSDRDVHAIFGWLRIGEVLDADRIDKAPAWLVDHPHRALGWPAANAIYVAADALGLPGMTLPGGGVFRHAYQLSVAPGALSRWQVPDWLARSRLSYHRGDRCWPGDGTMRVTAQWQEGVASADDEAVAWAAALIGEHA